ncbi:hypothetical protein [Cognatilysobacter segetis]|uniref:hypothetical protein n=1 Tax=Cognatilysobacter segetis TaxID=2492394 RepID=UPI00105D4D74|nr:hypothetical protein [Lysobacter segetis]
MRRATPTRTGPATLRLALAGAVLVASTAAASRPASTAASVDAAVPASPAPPADVDATPPALPEPPPSNIRWKTGRPPTPPPAGAPAPASNIRLPTATAPAVAAPEPEPPASNLRWKSPAPVVTPADTAAAAAAAESAEPVAIPDSPAEALRRALLAYRRTDDPRRFDTAFRLFQAAAAGGDLRARIAVGYLQAMGLGTQRDVATGTRALLAASAAGMARADYLLSLMEPAGSARETSLRASAAGRGDAAAQNAMGVHFARAGDRDTAELWLTRAAASGSPAAKANLARLAQSRGAQRQREADDAGAGAGEAASLFALAQRYHRGTGASVDYGQALRYYRAAAAKGHGPARRMLGLIQSRPAPDGAVDPAWMRQLATVDLGDGDRASAGAAPTASGLPAAAAPLQLDDPLVNLAGVAAPSPRTRKSP